MVRSLLNIGFLAAYGQFVRKETRLVSSTNILEQAKMFTWNCHIQNQQSRKCVTQFVVTREIIEELNLNLQLSISSHFV
jgi:hypothetical protein